MLLLLLLIQAASASEFDAHLVPVVANPPTCHTLDFNSYFRAERAKNNIIQANPDRTHANFAGTYLILKNELMLETSWFIADCNTGKFLHEVLDGTTADFKVNSNLIILGQKNAPSEYELWSGKEWTKIENAELPPNSSMAQNNTDTTSTQTAASTVAPHADTIAEYQSLFSKYAALITPITCKKLDYDSFFRSQRSKSNLISLNPDLTHPNFGGAYLLLKTESLFDTTWLIADCKTGIFYHEFFNGKITFHPESLLVIVNDTGKFPQLKTWVDNEWIQLPDPVQNKHQTAKNTLYGDNAKLLLKLMPNPGHDPTLRFLNLECKSNQCTVTSAIPGSAPITLQNDSATAVSHILEKYGATVIQTGRCSIQKNEAVCEIESAAI